MRIASSSSRLAGNARSIHRFLPLTALLLLVLSRTVFHHTRFEDSTFGFGLGVLCALTIHSALPGILKPKEPEANDLQLLDLGR